MDTRQDLDDASRQRRVVVTGGAGFIGSHVCQRFLDAGYAVLAVDNFATGRPQNVPSAVRLEELDVVNGGKLDDLFRSFQPSVVCHLAAQASVTVSVREPARDLEWNVSGTLNVVESARKVSAPVVFASTGGALYGERAPIPTTEDVVPLEPLAPYGASKLAGEAYVMTWARLYRMANVVLRLGNVYGPRQSPHGEAGVVAIFSNILRQGRAPVVYGDGLQTRDYVHVRDVAEAFHVVAGARRPGTFNVGVGQERTVLELLRVLQEAANSSVGPRFEPLRPGELLRSALDSTRLRAIGWTPLVPFVEGLRETFATYM